MMCTELAVKWADLVNAQMSCQLCVDKCVPPLIQPGARPLFGRFKVWENGTLFLFEAPNRDDTFNPNKGYLTWDPETDPTGRFAWDLMVNELRLNPDFFQVTNSVLCLPAQKGDKFPVGAAQQRLCSSHICNQIRTLDPRVVVPVGGAALQATRRFDDHGYRKMSDAVGQPIQWLGRWLFPLFHTSMLARNGPGGRREKDQRSDWRGLRAFLQRQGVIIP